VQVVIVGGGTFGASLAWWLARSGDEVTLVDQFEPGDRRATSGGETRLIRLGHGDSAYYTSMAWRARTLWRELEAESGADVFVECGIAWFAHGDEGWEADSERTIRELGIPCEHLDAWATAELFPSLRTDDLAWTLFEPHTGVLRAQRSVQTLAAQAAAHGARIIRSRAEPDGELVVLEDGTRLEGDAVVWSCGPWLGRLFPEHVSLRVTLQELLFFDAGPEWRGIPGWCDYDLAAYGTPDLDELGAKTAADYEGPDFDPDADLPDRTSTERLVREYFATRFPALVNAPLRESRTCRYETTPDTNFIAATHPEHDRVWLVGGGSGHGFKHGPAMAERLAAALRAEEELPAMFALGERREGRSLRTAGHGMRA
jgi:glycine/D-amino acid oxidase-like deaminating enzyme